MVEVPVKRATLSIQEGEFKTAPSQGSRRGSVKNMVVTH